MSESKLNGEAVENQDKQTEQGQEAQSQHKKIAVDEVKLREDLYPRIEPDRKLVEQYAEQIETIREVAPITLNQHNVLIDGNHRLLAHQMKGLKDIPYVVVETESDRHILRLAICANAMHGKQLTREEKKRMARTLLLGAGTTKAERTAARKEAAEDLAVTEESVRQWTLDLDKAAQEDEDRTIWNMHLACYATREIGKQVGLHHGTVAEKIKKLSENPIFWKTRQYLEPEQYDIWQWPSEDDGIIENLVHAYTDRMDVVLDPYAGRGATIDACKRLGRRYWVSDQEPDPIAAKSGTIRKHDVSEGPPNLPQGLWSNVRLLFLDPPHWYEEGASGLTPKAAEKFHDKLEKFISECADKMTKGGYIALLIEPTQWPLEDRSRPVDHAFELNYRLRAGGSKCVYVRTISCPHSKEQYSSDQVDQAKEAGEHLVLTRTLTVWRVKTI